MKIVRPIPADFSVIIEYPGNSGKVLLSRSINLYRVDGDGEETLITTCGALSVYADDRSIVWAEAELFADKDGRPIFTGPPVMNGAQIITKVFTCNVQEIRSQTSFTAGWREGYEHVTGKPAPPRPPLAKREPEKVSS